MKKHIAILVAAFGLATGNPLMAADQGGLENDPAYLAIDKAIDLKTIRPEVNVNLPRFLLQDAASTLNGGPNDPLAGTGINFADLVKDVKLIRVVVIEAGESNRSALEKGVKTLRAELDAKWTAVVTVPDENVGIYALGDPSGESMAGVAVLVNDGGEAVIVNIVGRVSIGKLIQIASRMDRFPKDLLKKIGGAQVSDGPAPAEEAKPEVKSGK